MTRPGEIDANGWRVPKRPRALAVYHLAKAGFEPRQIAKMIRSTAASVSVMLHWMRRPKLTPHGYSYEDVPKTRQRRHDFTGMYVEKSRQSREREIARERARQFAASVSEREQKAYNGSRYA